MYITVHMHGLDSVNKLVVFMLQTYIGKVVISINPYEKLTIYTDDYVAQYRSRNMFELPPHM